MSRVSTSQSGLEKAARIIRQLQNIDQLINKFPQKYTNTDKKRGSINTARKRIEEAKSEVIKTLEENNIKLINENSTLFLEATESDNKNWKQTRIAI